MIWKHLKFTVLANKLALLLVLAFLTSFLANSSLHAQNPLVSKECKINLPVKGGKTEYTGTSLLVSPPYEYGFFSYFTMVLGFLDQFEKGMFKSVRVDFGERGLYYDAAFGPNWWTYYFDPVAVGEFKNVRLVKSSAIQCYNAAIYARDVMPRKRAHELIQRYIRVKPHILAEVNQYMAKNFTSHYVIGVHYRGTDKFTSGEANFTSYETVIDALRDHLKTLKRPDYKIFVATDELAFLKHMQELFPDRIICLDALRSNNGDPVHLNTRTPYQTGKEALVDSLLLSNTDFLIRTPSNLSVCSCHFDPELPNIVINGDR